MMGEPRVDAGPGPAALRRVAASCLVGSAIEFYDFLIYGTAAALVFPTVFFPQLGSTAGTIASLGTFATAFISRPIGAAVFGYYGDRLGRKKTLIATLLIMAVSTVGVGLVPSTASIGVAAPLLLILLRLLQGFAVGGEWAGSALLSAEYAPAGQRGRFGMFTLLGGGAAAVFSSLTFLAVNITIGENSPAFMEWGWRVPFLISAGLIGIALYVRVNIDETPIFVEEKARNLVPEAPLAEVLRLHRREILLAAGSILGGMAFVHMGNTYLTIYAHNHLGYTRTFIWSVGALARAGKHHVCRHLGHPVRPSRASPDDVAGVGWVSAVVFCGDPTDGYATTTFSMRWPSSACSPLPGSAPARPEPSSPSCSPPVTATADRRWR